MKIKILKFLLNQWKYLFKINFSVFQFKVWDFLVLLKLQSTPYTVSNQLLFNFVNTQSVLVKLLDKNYIFLRSANENQYNLTRFINKRDFKCFILRAQKLGSQHLRKTTLGEIRKTTPLTEWRCPDKSNFSFIVNRKTFWQSFTPSYVVQDLFF